MAPIIQHFFDEHLDDSITEVKSLCVGRNGQNDVTNEDFVVVYESERLRSYWAIDGITSLTSFKAPVECDGREDYVTGGWLAARVIAKHATRLEEGMDPSDFWADVVEDWNFCRIAHGFPDDEIIGAVACGMVQFSGRPPEAWQLGDCGWGYLTAGKTPVWVDSMDGQTAPNSHDADVRAEAIFDRLRQMGFASVDEIAHDPAALADLASYGWGVMKEGRRKTSDYSWLTDIDRMMAHTHAKPPVVLTEPMVKLMLCTDGPQKVHPTIPEALGFLTELQKDLLTIGNNPYDLRTAKGFVDKDNGKIRPYPDDLGMIEVTFRPR